MLLTFDLKAPHVVFRSRTPGRRSSGSPRSGRCLVNVRWVAVAVELVGLFLITVIAIYSRLGPVSVSWNCSLDSFALPGKPVRFASWTCVPFRATASFVFILSLWFWVSQSGFVHSLWGASLMVCAIRSSPVCLQETKQN